MLRGDEAYRNTGGAGDFGSDGAYGGDADSGEGVHDINRESVGAFEQGAHGVGAGEQEPIEGAKIAQRFIERSEIGRRMESDHGLKNGFGAAGFEFANQGFGLVRGAGDEDG